MRRRAQKRAQATATETKQRKDLPISIDDVRNTILRIQEEQEEQFLPKDIHQAARSVFYNPRTGFMRDARTLLSRLPPSIKDKVIRDNLTDKLQSFLNAQETIQENTQRRVHRTSHGTISAQTPGHKLQSDLLDMKKFLAFDDHASNKWILTVVDVYSRKAWAAVLKTKGTEDVTPAIKSILDEIGEYLEASGYPPIDSIQTDQGVEFKNQGVARILKIKDIELHENELDDHEAQGIVERFNQTLRRKLQLFWTAHETRVWQKILPEIIYNYNNTVHSTLGATPDDIFYGRAQPLPPGAAMKQKEDDLKTELKQKEREQQKTQTLGEPQVLKKKIKIQELKKKIRRLNQPNSVQRRIMKLRIGDRVRIYIKPENLFSKRAHLASYSKEVYVITNLNKNKTKKSVPVKHPIRIVPLAAFRDFIRHGPSGDPPSYITIRADYLKVVKRVETIPQNEMRAYKRTTQKEIKEVVTKQQVERRNKRAAVSEQNIISEKRVRKASSRLDL